LWDGLGWVVTDNGDTWSWLTLSHLLIDAENVAQLKGLS
jgi:hypothetical protein